MRFPVYFDVEAGAKKAQADLDRLHRALENLMKSKPVEVNIDLAKAMGNIDGISAKLKDLRVRWNSMEFEDKFKDGKWSVQAKGIIDQYASLTEAAKKYGATLDEEYRRQQRIANAEAKAGKGKSALRNQERSISEITQKLSALRNKLNEAALGSRSFEKITAEIERLTRKLAEADAQARALSGGLVGASGKAGTALKGVNSTLREQDGYVSRLVKRLAVYASFSYTMGFLTQIREVTAEFELQRVSLGAILQSQEKANKLFSEIKSFALKSPVKILDLTKYTKQLAAYKIGYDELFETTKKLTDVSVGLGVSMDRVVLAYGQVRATGYLRASEIRQFTEMGVPIVEELAQKLSKMNGELVTAADVMEMVSKRGISFGMVKEVFDDMTSAGGIFYNMQEKQGDTLYGMWAKLGDAASVMYEQIGNTGWVNSAMRGMIKGVTELMRNWRQAGTAMSMLGAGMIVYAIQMRNARIAEAAGSAASAERVAALRAEIAALEAKKAAEAGAGRLTRWNTATTLAATKAQLGAATATNMFSKALYGLKAAVATSWPTMIITAVATLVTYLAMAEDKTKKLAEDLDSIKADTAANAEKSAYNFERLANKAVQAADGSKEQKDALDELQRTYREMIPAQDMTIERLREMRGDYRDLTAAIREYAYQSGLQRQADSIVESYSGTITAIEKELRDLAKNTGVTPDEMSALFARIKSDATATSKDVKSIIKEAVDDIFGYMNDKDRSKFQYLLTVPAGGETDGKSNTLTSLITLQREMDEKIKETTESAAKYTGVLGKLNKVMEEYEKIREGTTNNIDASKRPYDYAMQEARNVMQSMSLAIEKNDELTEDVKKQSEDVQRAWREMARSLSGGDGEEALRHMGEMLEMLSGQTDDLSRNLRGLIGAFKGKLGDLVPTDPIVKTWRDQWYFLNGGKMAQDQQFMNEWLMNQGEKLEDYSKKVKDGIDGYDKHIKELQATLKKNPNAEDRAQMEADIKKAERERDLLKSLGVPDFSESRGKGRGKGDQRLQNVKEEISLTEKLYNDYKQFEKLVGSDKAKERMEEDYAQVLPLLQSKAKAYGFEYKNPWSQESLKENIDAYVRYLETLSPKTFPGLERTIADYKYKSDKSKIDKVAEEIKDELKRLAERVAQSKMAKEFYDKILGQTGDADVAGRIARAIYGADGSDLFQQQAQEIRQAFGDSIDLSGVIDEMNERIDYRKLGEIYDKYGDQIAQASRETAAKIVKEGQKAMSADMLNWQKTLAKEKSFEERRLDIIRRGAEERAEIIKKMAGADTKDRDNLIALSYSKQAKELSKLAVDEFKSSNDYERVFQNLDKVSSQTLDRMKGKLQDMIKLAKETENVEGMKILVQELEKIESEQIVRDPIKGMIKSFRDYAKARKEYRLAEANEAKVKGEYKAKEGALDKEIADAQAQKAAAEQRMNELREQGSVSIEEQVKAETDLNTATKKVELAEEKKRQAQGEVADAEEKRNDALDNQKKAEGDFKKSANAAANSLNSAADAIENIAEMMGIAEDSALGDMVSGMVGGLRSAASIMGTILTLALAIQSACWWLVAIGAAVAAFTAIFSIISGSKVRRANKIIEEQKGLVEELEHAYSRLEKAIEKALGTDIISGFSRQKTLLQAQISAYTAMASAERSKGKKADDDKIKEYEQKIRDLRDEIADMEGQIAERLTGSDVTSAARDFAQSWLEAYASYSNTLDAMKGKMQDLVKNIVVEGALARVAEKALEPVYKMIDSMSGSDFYSKSFWGKVADMAQTAAADADAGLGVLTTFLERSGIKVKETTGEYSGLKREVAGATSEEMNANTAALNTQNFYMSQTLGEVRLIRQLMEIGNGGKVSVNRSEVDVLQMQTQAMNHLGMIEAYAAETSARCQRSALACEQMLMEVKKVIKPKGVKGSYSVSVEM